MEANPYAPPKTKVADHESTGHGLKHRSVWMMVLLTIVTLGIYYFTWWFRRRGGLNRLNSSKKLSIWPPVLLAVLFVVFFILGIFEGLVGDDDPTVQTARLWASLFQIVVGIALLIYSFRIKGIIEDHAAPDAHAEPMFAKRVQLSGVMTFLFSIYYLQWAINRYVVARS